MNRLDRYLFQQGALPFLLILLCTTAVIWLTQILQRVDLMVEDGGSLYSFAKVTVLLVPSLVGVIIPFALIAAVLYSLNVLAVDSELPVMGAAGASRLRIARPLLVLSFLASIMVFIINVDLQPRSYRVMKETVESVRSDIARSLIRSGIFSEVTPGVTVYAEEARPGDQYIGLLIHDAREEGNPVSYTAEQGLFRITPAGPRLLLLRGTVQRTDPETGNVEILRFIETAVDLASLKSSTSGRRNLESTERYVSELFNPDMTNEYDRDRLGQFIAEGHARFATALYPLTFGFLACAQLLSAPVSRRGYSRYLMMVIATAILIRTLGYISQSMAATTPVFNILQYVIPIIGIVGAAIILIGRFWRAKRRPPPDLAVILENPSRVGVTL